MLTGIDPMRLAEIDAVDGSMLVALRDAALKRRTPEMELLRTLIWRVDLLWRQTVANAGGTPPDPLEIRLPGDKPKQVQRRSFGALAQALMGGGA